MTVPTLRQQAVLARRRNGLLRQTRAEYFERNRREPGIVGGFHVLDLDGIFAVITMTAARDKNGNPEITISSERYYADFETARKAMNDARDSWMLEHMEPPSGYDN